MKRVGGLWSGITDFDNLLSAYRKARQGKRYRPEVALFDLSLEQNLFELREQLLSGTYRPGRYRQFTIYDRKARLISAAPFRDRVVHHARSNGLRKAVLGSVSFTRAADRTMRPACAAGRRLEQQTEEPPLREPQQEPRG